MMQLCGSCAQQVAQTGAALAPTLWLLALAAVTAMVAKGGSKKGKGK
jgi:mannose/fructose/N-acetylgalactosamine-specific phosphotransferase system component IID